MLAFRSVVSVLVSFVRSFSTNSRPACGRPLRGRPRPPTHRIAGACIGRLQAARPRRPLGYTGTSWSATYWCMAQFA